MTIVFLLTGTQMGGAEKQVFDVARGLAGRGHRVTLVSLTPPGPVADEARAAGLRVESLGMSPGVPDPRGVLRLVALLRAVRPDVVHSHLFHANLLARLTRRLARVPVLVCTIHSARVGGKTWAWSYRATDRLADLTTIISQVAATRHVEAGAVPRGRLAVVPNGIDVTRFQRDEEARVTTRRELGLDGEFVWMAVGRYEPDKDYPNLLRAFAAVDGSRRRIARARTRLLVVGEGPGRAAIEQQAHQLGLTDSVAFLGLRRDVPRLLNAADGYVMSSAWEGLPLVLLEAAAVELPIVSTAVGGTGEVVRDDETGLLVPADDSVALAHAMERIMRLDPPARRAMGQGGRAHVLRHFALDAVVARWEEVYDALAAQRKI